MATGLVIFCGSLLLGAVPFGLIVGRINGIDVRDAGSGNIGATNVTRLLGRRWGLLVLLLDVAKGLVPTRLFAFFVLEPAMVTEPADQRLIWLWLAVGFAAVMGHNFSPFLRFRGGKGVATSLGMALGVYPDLTLPAAFSAIVWLVSVRVSRVVAVGSVLAGIALPLGYMLTTILLPGTVERRTPFVCFTVAMGLMIVVRHRSNLARMVAGDDERG